MAKYKYSKYLTQDTGSGFDSIYEPGQANVHSGIYYCEGCGHEITHVKDKPLPPQNHHTHTTAQGKIRWRLIVYTMNQ